ncbi:MAG: DUF1835 domain-containing protein [Candidatus Thiodiazotropha endolucinida]|nr:DUF1835 domain-containing protein [Candidatus Thiodiazotropha taylori]MCW4312116.1 DUF1835 domain-containing protein [Candidatus Thiodiazotropha taylori]
MIQSLPALRRQFHAEQKQFHQLPGDDPRSLQSLSLEQSKKQAKQLLKALNQGNAWSRTESHPKAESLQADQIKLADAQLIIAREHGFPSWPKLKHHLETSEMAAKAIKNGNPDPLDGQLRTLHIRCGTDVMYKLAVAGFRGDFLCFADPYIQGPVPAEPDRQKFIDVRSRFIADNQWRLKPQAVKELTGDYDALERIRDYQRVCFWFEHDAYDVLVFIKLLHFLRDRTKRAEQMAFICVDHYPGVARFNGIGQLPVETMPLLWQQFAPLEEQQIEFGGQCWEAYTASTPEALSRIVNLQSPAFPQILPALKRHIRELPWRADGLSLSERLTLQILHEQGSQDGAKLFYHWYTSVYEPLAFMGDSSYWKVLSHLAEARRPAIELLKGSSKPVDWQVSLTGFGRKLLAGEGHWLAHNDYDVWFGGVHNCTPGALWYWDDDIGRVIQA